MVEIAVQSEEQSKHGNVAINKCIQKRTVLVLSYNANKILGKL